MTVPDKKVWDVGVSAVVVRGQAVLFVRYAYGSRQGTWTLPSGYANHDETLAQAAARELREEAGLLGEPGEVVSVRSRFSDEGGAVFVGFRVRCQAGDPAPDGREVDAARFFTASELETLSPVLELSRQVALAVLAAPDAGLVETEIPGRSGPAYRAYMVKKALEEP
jgi:8-oxo-dGTP diphosphatase